LASFRGTRDAKSATSCEPQLSTHHHSSEIQGARHEGENQNVQSPRENQNVQSPRGKRMGATHDSVRAGQAALKAQGFDPGEIDGVYGPSTQAALTNYQRSNGLRETGRFDHATLAKLGVGSTSR
jgi:peptidoglycan hydrolase-like protein with peptidoglycan-binding domain